MWLEGDAAHSPKAREWGIKNVRGGQGLTWTHWPAHLRGENMYLSVMPGTGSTTTQENKLTRWEEWNVTTADPLAPGTA